MPERSNPQDDELPPPGGSRLNLPRFVFWILGAAIAGGGALIARKVGDIYPEFRIASWLIGSAIIFLGLAVLSLGTRSRLDQTSTEEESPESGA